MKTLSVWGRSRNDTSSRSGQEVADLAELSVTADPLVGGYNDKFELVTLSSQRVRRSRTPLLHFEAAFFVLSAADICIQM